jgi:hypothetical protein
MKINNMVIHKRDGTAEEGKGKEKLLKKQLGRFVVNVYKAY